MSGKFYFLDTNSIIQLLKGNQELVKILQEAEFIACSVISKLEYLSFPNMSEHQQIINLRQQKTLKLPDAIIVGCSIYKNCTLITADKKILEINGLNVLSYQVI